MKTCGTHRQKGLRTPLYVCEPSAVPGRGELRLPADWEGHPQFRGKSSPVFTSQVRIPSEEEFQVTAPSLTCSAHRAITRTRSTATTCMRIMLSANSLYHSCRIPYIPCIDREGQPTYLRQPVGTPGGNVDRSGRILEHASSELRELIEQELAAQRFGEVARLARLAESLSNLASGREGSAEAQPTGVPTAEHEAVSTLARPSVRANPTGSSRRTNGKSYPLFEREGLRLVKVGWSKRDSSTYEHKAPKDTVNAVRTALLDKANTDGDFQMEEVFPVASEDGSEIPSYQVYLVVAWFRKLGIVERRGKTGYRLARRRLNSTKLSTAWASLNERGASDGED